MLMSFIIPCYNQIEYTQQCIQSILRNIPEGHEIDFVFIDNNSQDGTYEYLQTIPNNYIIRNKTNLLVNPAWNQGFAYVLRKNHCDYVCLCNNDIIGGKGWLDPIFESLQLYENQFYIPSGNFDPNPCFFDRNDLDKLSYAATFHPIELRKINISFPGFCFFMKRKHINIFYPIPDEIKVLHGDDWIVDILNHNCIFPMQVNKCLVYHYGSTTQRSMNLSELHLKDHAAFDRIYNSEYEKRGMKRIYEQKPPKIKIL